MRLNARILIPWLLFTLVLISGFALFEWQLKTLRAELTQHLRLHQDAVKIASDLRYSSLERLNMALEHPGHNLDATVRKLTQSESQTVVLIGQLERVMSPGAGHGAVSDQINEGSQILNTYRLTRSSLPALYRDWLQAAAASDPLEPIRRQQLLQQVEVTRATLDDLANFHEITQQLVSEEAGRDIETTEWLFFGVMGGLLLAVLGFSFYQGYTVVVPLRQLSGAAQAVSRGENARFDVGANVDEIDSLSRSLGHMLATIQKSHAEVKRQEERFHRVVQATPIGMVVLNQSGQIVMVNNKAEQMFGYEHGQLDGQPSEVLVPVRFRATNAPQRLAFLAAPQACYLDAQHGLTAQRQNGQEFPVEVGLNPIDSAEGTMALAIVVDITERLALERDRAQYQERLEADVTTRTAELRNKTAELELAIKDLESFSYSVSHDLRAPLRAIDGFVEMLLEDHATQLDDDGRRMFGVVQENARKMGCLIDDILAFSRAGRLEMDWQDIDMNELLQEVWRDLARERNGYNVQLQAPPLPAIKGDPRAVRQVLHNLIANAVKFSRTRHPGVVALSAAADGPLVRFTVQDNGVGFKPEFANKLFVLFQRLHGMDEFEGTGVGLAIVKRFVLKHGGTVSATAVPNQGATFTFSLPTVVPDNVTVPADQPAVPAYH